MNENITTYEKYFFEFFRLSKTEFTSINEFFNKVKEVVKQQNEAIKNNGTIGKATIVIGYSGNGKTTYINNNKDENSYVISMDQVTKELYYEKNESKASPLEIIKRFGEKLEEAYRNKKKDIYIDGLWLNLLTRMSLIQTLKSFGYDVTLVSLLDKDFVNNCLKNRIEDETKHLSKDSDEYQRKKDFIINFHNDEEKRNVVNEQIQNDMFKLGTNHYIDFENSIEL